MTDPVWLEYVAFYAKGLFWLLAFSFLCLLLKTLAQSPKIRLSALVVFTTLALYGGWLLATG